MSKKAQKPRPERHTNHLPVERSSTSEILNVLTHQSEYIDQLEKENRFLKDELAGFRRRLDEVIKENQNLHDGIRSDIIHQTISKASIVASENEKEFSQDQERYLSQKYSSADKPNEEKKDSREKLFKQWKQEMENIKAIYEAKIDGLEAEVQMTKKDLEYALNEGGDFRERIKTLEGLLKTPMHIKDTDSTRYFQKEAISFNANVPLIERLTKERDDLMKSVASMRNSFMDAQRNESLLRQEVQKSLAMLEDMQLEKARTKLENDRLRKDLDLTRQRLDTEISSSQKRISDAAAHQRKACQDDMNELLKKIGEMTTILSTYENSIEAAGREKAALTIQVDDARRQLLAANEDLGKMRSEIEHEVHCAIKGYKGAEEELRNTKTKLQQELAKTQQERARLEHEAIEQQRRLSSAQSEALASNELNVTLTQQLNDALHRLQDIRQEKERVGKDLQEKMTTIKSEAEDKENRLEDIISRSEIEYQQRLSDLETISSKQSNLIQRLREEGKTMENELKRGTKKFRKEIGLLSQDEAVAKARMNRLVAANRELEEQIVQHGITHREMQVRLRELDERSRRTTGFVAEVAEENDRLILDKSMLQKEVEFLQSEVLTYRSA